MNRCPNELLMEIASFACTDDGYTGRSLSLVSRKVHLASATCRLQSISLHSPRDIFAFRDLLDSKPPRECVVRNLFMSVTSTSDLNQDEQRGIDQLSCLLWAGENAELIDNVQSAMTEILAMIAPYIQVLTIVATSFDQYFLLPAFPRDLPLLEELHICGLFFGGSETARVVDQLPKAGRLRRLHLTAGSGGLQLPSTFTGFLSRSYPCLTHLRLFGLVDERSSGDLFTAIEKLVHSSEASMPEAEPSSGTGSFPNHPFHIYVIPGPPMYVCGNFRGKRAHQLMREKLRDLTSAASDSGQLVLPYHPKYYYEYMNREFVSLEKWWMERVVGEEKMLGYRGSGTGREHEPFIT